SNNIAVWSGNDRRNTKAFHPIDRRRIKKVLIYLYALCFLRCCILSLQEHTASDQQPYKYSFHLFKFYCFLHYSYISFRSDRERDSKNPPIFFAETSKNR